MFFIFVHPLCMRICLWVCRHMERRGWNDYLPLGATAEAAGPLTAPFPAKSGLSKNTVGGLRTYGKWVAMVTRPLQAICGAFVAARGAKSCGREDCPYPG